MGAAFRVGSTPIKVYAVWKNNDNCTKKQDLIAKDCIETQKGKTQRNGSLNKTLKVISGPIVALLQYS